MRLPGAGRRAAGASVIASFALLLHQQADPGHLRALQFVHHGKHGLVLHVPVAGDQHRLVGVLRLRLPDALGEFLAADGDFRAAQRARSTRW